MSASIAAKASALPGIDVTPVTIVRRSLAATYGLTEEADPTKAYSLSLAYIVRDIQQGSLDRRLRAARQVGDLLRIIRLRETAAGNIPRTVSRRIKQPVLVRMVQEVMKDPDAVVRAEMIASLRDVVLDKQILQELAPSLDDLSPLVRLRLAETLRTAGPDVSADWLNRLGADSDPLVARMARVPTAAQTP